MRRIGSLDGLNRDPPRLVEIAGEKQRLRQAREHTNAQHVRACPGGRNRAACVLHGRAHVTALDHHRTCDLSDRLDVWRPQPRPICPRALRHCEQLLSFDLRKREHRCGKRPDCRQRRVLEEQLGGKPAHPANELSEPPTLHKLEMVL